MAPGAHPSPITETLGRLDVFADLDEGELSRLASLFGTRSLPDGERIHQAPGAPERHVFVVLGGEVSVYRDEVGRPLQLRGRLGVGETFGDAGLFGDVEGVSALARGDVTLAAVRHRQLLDFLDDHPEVALKMQIAAVRRHSENVAAALDASGREDLRIRVDRSVALDLPFNQRIAASLENLSVGGLCLDGIPESWREGMRMSFHLHVLGQVVPVDARISWRQGSLAGLAFVETDDAHERRIRRLLQALREDLVREVGAAGTGAVPDDPDPAHGS